MELVAIILTLIQPLIDKAFIASLEKWANHVGLSKEFIALKEELTLINNNLRTAGDFDTKNSELLKGLQQLIYEADELLDKLDYYRIQHDITLNAGNSSTQTPIAIRKVGPIGGLNGTMRDMDTTGVAHISSIGIRHGWAIDALILRYQVFGRKERTDHWGGQGGQLTEITLEPKEYIVAITGYHDHLWNMRVVRSINFVTNFGSYGPFGLQEGIRFELSALGGQIIGLHACCGILINAIGIYVKVPVPLKRLEAIGGFGGTVRDMDTTGVSHISNIAIRHGQAIDALIFRYQAFGRKASTNHWGGQGGQLTEITLQPNEYIVAITGYHGHLWNMHVVRSLKFVTNYGSYGPFGFEEGIPFELPALDGQIIGFHARCGRLLDAIGIYVKMAHLNDSSSSSSNSSAQDVVLTLPSNIVSRMKELVQPLREASENVHNALNLEAVASTARENVHNQATVTNQRETNSRMKETVYGRDKERDDLINLLVDDEAASQTLSVIAIVGHGGIGKTTLAQLVYNNHKLKTYFDKRMWVTVSVNLDVTRLTQKIVKRASGSNHERLPKLDILQTELEEGLKKKRFFLVLDDLWQIEDTSHWEELLKPLKKGSTKGNVVLVTTRNPGVAKLDCSIKSICLGGLEDGKYWSLFKACTFGDDKYKRYMNLEHIGRKIIEKLKGNPLAAKTVGALLRKSLDECYWMRVLKREEWKNQDGVHDIMPALRISYKYLPFHLQRCFSYCALFPKDYKFNLLELVNIWIAQGMLYTEGKKLEDVGRNYLDDLVNSGFFQENEDRYGYGFVAYVIHDLLHDLAQLVSTEECLRINGGELQRVHPTTRHLSILPRDADDGIRVDSNFEKELIKVEEHLELEKLTTIMFFGDKDSIDPETLERFQSKFKYANGLTVLRLDPIPNVQLLLSSLPTFTRLRYLRLCSNYMCDTIPKVICQLYHLQVLDVRNWKNLLKLPNDFNNLISLRHFVPWNVYLYLLIAGVGKLAHIQELHLFGVKKEREFAIEQLRDLNELRGELRIDNLENVKSMEEAMVARLNKKPLINSLQLSWKNSDVGHAIDEDVLEGLQPHPNLKELIISGYGGGTSPTWLTNKNVLTYLEDVILFNCMAWEILPPLGQLPYLKRLELKSMSTVREIGSDLYGFGKDMAFQCLEVLKLQDMPKLAKWIWNDRCLKLSSLTKLSTWKCPELDLPLTDCASEAEFKGRFPRLDDLQISECPKLLGMLDYLDNKESIIHPCNIGSFERFIPSISELVIENPRNQGAWDNIRFHNLRTITYLEIAANRFPLAWENLCLLFSLETMNLRNCPVLFSFPNSESDTQKCWQLKSLKRFTITACDITGKQLSWMLRHVPVLKRLLLEECCRIKSIEAVTEGSNLIASQVVELREEEGLLQIPSSLTFLKKLFIWLCPNMVFGSKKGLSDLVSMRELSIQNCSGLFTSMVFEEMSNKAHLLPPGLQRLILHDVPEGISQFLEGLSSLTDLRIGSSGLKSLDITSCPGLEILMFEDCPKLASLKDLKSLPHLKHLKVEGCAAFADAWISASNIGFSIPLGSLDIDTATLLLAPICRQLTSLQYLTFRNNVVDLTEEQEESLLLLTSLKVIEFDKCVNLQHLPAKIHLLPSVERLIISVCPNIQSMPENGLPKSLIVVQVEYCGYEVEKMFEKYKRI